MEAPSKKKKAKKEPVAEPVKAPAAKATPAPSKVKESEVQPSFVGKDDVLPFEATTGRK